MAPVNLLCKGFLRSLADSDQPQSIRFRNQAKRQLVSKPNADNDYDYAQRLLHVDDDLTADPVTKAKLDVRKQRLTAQTIRAAAHSNKVASGNVAEQRASDQQLRHLMLRTFALRV